MAGAREIQSRMKSIQDTMKITNAMYMISSSKLKRVKKRLEDTEPYFYALQSVLERIARHFPDIQHRYIDPSPDRTPAQKKTGYLVITGDKGLAGAYNHNVMKLAEQEMNQGGGNDTLFVVGQVGVHYFQKKGMHVDTHFHYTAQNPTMNRARIISEKLLELYDCQELDEIYVIYTKMTNSIHMEAVMTKLLPLERHRYEGHLPANVPMQDMVLFPTPDAVIDSIVPNYVTGFIYGALVESFSSEQNSRMMAMEAATRNAREMLKSLEIEYNRVRQAAITQEITEVISGAKAQKRKKGGASSR